MPDVPEGSIVITPKEFYDGVKQDIADIKASLAPLSQMHDDVEELKVRVSSLERKFWWAAGFAAAAGTGAGAIVSKLLGAG